MKYKSSSSPACCDHPLHFPHYYLLFHDDDDVHVVGEDVVQSDGVRTLSEDGSDGDLVLGLAGPGGELSHEFCSGNPVFAVVNHGEVAPEGRE